MPPTRRAKALIIALAAMLGLMLYFSLHSTAPNPYLQTMYSYAESSRRTAAGPPAKFPEARQEIEKLIRAHTILVFSKSKCPYSKKAKHVMLDKYKIVPPPFVIELDLKEPAERGKEIQEELQLLTGRGTVPNVMIAGKSIGGGDDVESLDKEGKLADMIRNLGGGRIKQIFALKE